MMTHTQMHRLAGAESAIRAELVWLPHYTAAVVQCRNELQPVGLDYQGRHSTRISSEAPTVKTGNIAAEVLQRADVQRDARRLHLRRRLIDAAWWIASPLALLALYAIAARLD